MFFSLDIFDFYLIICLIIIKTSKLLKNIVFLFFNIQIIVNLNKIIFLY